MKQLILGSQSPRRLEVLSHFTLPFKQMTPPFCEESIPFAGNPGVYVSEIARGKAESLAKNHPEAIVLTADTTVSKGNRVYNKPTTSEEVYAMLGELANAWHSVFTGVCVISGGQCHEAFEETKVLFNPLSKEQIHDYHLSLNCFDKAGGYAIQMPGALAIQKIEGCYYNVIGLPINTVRKLLLKVGLDLWHYLK